MAGLGSYEEIDRSWNFCDLQDALEILDLKEEAEAKAYRQAMKRKGR